MSISPHGGNDSDTDTTALLVAWREGSREAFDRLFELLYDELRILARRQLRAARGTLNTTAVVHEAYVRLVDRTRSAVEDRHHFFAIAAKAMRHILVDHARRRGAAKRGGGAIADPFGAEAVPVVEHVDELLAINEALGRLESLDPRLGRLVELRFFGGLSVEETADVLDLSARTVKRDWRKARAFLLHEMSVSGAG